MNKKTAIIILTLIIISWLTTLFLMDKYKKEENNTPEEQIEQTPEGTKIFEGLTFDHVIISGNKDDGYTLQIDVINNTENTIEGFDIIVDIIKKDNSIIDSAESSVKTTNPGEKQLVTFSLSQEGNKYEEVYNYIYKKK